MTDNDKALVERLRGDLPDKKVESHWITDYTAVEMQNREAADRIETQAAEIEQLRGHLEIWIFHNQRAMGQKPDDARAYAKAWLFRNAGGEEPE